LASPTRKRFVPSLDISSLTDEKRSTGMWAASLLHAIARDEAAGRRMPRLTEPRLDTWTRFRGRLTSVDLISLLFEDAAVLHRIPFDVIAVGGALQPEQLPESLTDQWLEALPLLALHSSGVDYVLEQARLLGLPTRMARSDLHMVKPHQKVLELPGTGGQLAHHLASSQLDLTLQDNFLVSCSNWQELTLAGIVALELAAPNSDFASRVDVEELKRPDHWLRQRSFDFVVGLRPDKGGVFRVEDQLAMWFPAAKILLV
jgi:hypothetical protein